MGKRYKDSLQPLGDKIEENQLYVNHKKVEIIFSYLWKGDRMQINIKVDCLSIILVKFPYLTSFLHFSFVKNLF